MNDPPPANRSSPDEGVGLGRVAVAPGLIVPASALRFSFARSSGPGGQNVNKVSSKAELRIALADLPLTDAALLRLRRLAGRRIVGDTDGESTPEGELFDPRAGELLITSEATRSQHRNRQACLDQLRALLIEARHRPRPRKKTKPSRGAIERRLREKKQRSQTKQRRSNKPHPSE